LVLCPVDFSDASRGALRYAAAIAEHFYAVLTVLSVNDSAVNDLAVFVDSTFSKRRPLVEELQLETANGLPPVEILRVANERQADVIVMSTHGLHGPRTMLGSVTERVLRETAVPVIVTPATDAGPSSVEEWTRSLRRVLVPVDLSPWTPQQVAIGRGIAEALDLELLFLHVLGDTDCDRRLAAHAQLDHLIHETPASLRPALTLAVGEPAAQIARVAKERAVDLIVMALHTSTDPRKGMGHVTYGVLCSTPTLVVACPPTDTKITKDTKITRDTKITKIAKANIDLKEPELQL
jgi:nucleotide-binding universal stress UspA family protein